MDVIRFYRPSQAYGEFSNFAPFPIEVDGLTWPTSEHYFQAQKHAGTAYAEQIRRAPTPTDAASLGRDRAHPMRRDWYGVRDDAMRTALRAKFTQHKDLGALLLGTGDAYLVEHTPNDRYWADGGDGRGRNRLGLLLMELRGELRAEAEDRAG